MHSAMMPVLPGFHIEAVEHIKDEFIIVARAETPEALCPQCHQPSNHIHSWYERNPRELPSCGVAVRLCLRVRRFFCRNATCLRKIFCERLADFVPVYERRTTQFTQMLTLLAMALGGRGGSRIVSRLQMGVSRDTLLRLIRRESSPAFEAPRVLGIDDWAFRKGHDYGTIICDLERGRVIDLLPDREAETLKTWLQKHPTVEILARDRSKTYAHGMSEGAPAAVQIADRWHLMNNLVEAVESILAQHRGRLVWQSAADLEEILPFKAAEAEMLALPAHLSPRQSQERQKRREARQQQYNKSLTLRAKGLTIEEIAAQVDISDRTVGRWLKAGSFPERKKRARQASLLDPFHDYLNKRWEEGCRSAAQLHREIQQQGFAGSYALVAQYGWLRRRQMVTHKDGTWQATGQQSPANIKRYTPRQAAFLFVRPKEKLETVEKEDLAQIVSDCPELSSTYQLAYEFATLLRERDVTILDSWIHKSQETGAPAMKSFANGIKRDYPEVKAALTHKWSNGPVEGHVNRLKMIKRQMFGRANFDLLRQRVLHRF
jgi:transposase